MALKDKLLIDSLRSGNLGWVKSLLPDLGHINEIKVDDASLIEYATFCGHPEIIKFLIKKRINVDQVGANGKCALTTAIENNFHEIVAILLSNGADLNHVDYRGATPLTTALQRDRYKIVRLLVDAGANVNKIGACEKTPLSLAVRNGEVKMMKFLLENGAVFTIHSAFLEAIASRSLETVRVLHEMGARLDLSHATEYAPLIKAVEMEHFEIVKYLVEHGADVNEMDAKGRTPLSIAAFKQDLRTFDYLIKAGADLRLAMEKIEKIASLGMDLKIYLHSMKADNKVKIEGVRVEGRRYAEDGNQEAH